MSSHPSQRGLTLVELMVALLLGLLILGTLIAVFIQNKSSFHQDDVVGQMQENARIAMQVLSRDLSMVNFFGEMASPSAVVPPAGSPSTDCGPLAAAYDVGAAATHPVLELLSRVTLGSTANASFSCIGSSEFYPGPDSPPKGTDILSLKRTLGAFSCANPSTTPGCATKLQDDKVYLRSNRAAGQLFVCSLSGSACSNDPSAIADPAPDDAAQDWEYLVDVYYIRKYSNAPTDGIPTLYRKILSSNPPAMITESGGIAEGVENFHVLLGWDTDSDGIANVYSATSPGGGALAVSARIYLLMRSSQMVPGYTDRKSYQLGDLPLIAAKNDGYYRRVYTTTVELRNPLYLGAF